MQRCKHLKLLEKQKGGGELYMCEIKKIRLGSPSADMCKVCENYEPMHCQIFRELEKIKLNKLCKEHENYEPMHCQIFRKLKERKLNKSIDSYPEEIISLDEYHPWHHGHNPNFDNFSILILDVKKGEKIAIDYFTNMLRFILSSTEEYVICVMPNHAAGTAPSGIRTIAKQLCSPPIIDGTDVLSRKFEIPKKATGGSRDPQKEIESLTVRNESIVKDRQVLLMDDVTTTGTSLKAGKYVIERAGAKLVVMLALAKTQSK